MSAVHPPPGFPFSLYTPRKYCWISILTFFQGDSAYAGRLFLSWACWSGCTNRH